MRALPKPVTLFVASAATAVGLVGGAGFAMAQDTTTPSAPDRATHQHQSDGSGHHGLRGDHTPSSSRDAALAEKLGVSEQQVHDAFESMKAAHEVTQDESHDPTEALAQALGKEVYEVRDAMEALREDKESQARDELATRMDDAIAAGKLSNSDKDAILKGFDAGVLTPQHGHRGGPQDGQQPS